MTTTTTPTTAQLRAAAEDADRAATMARIARDHAAEAAARPENVYRYERAADRYEEAREAACDARAELIQRGIEERVR